MRRRRSCIFPRGSVEKALHSVPVTPTIFGLPRLGWYQFQVDIMQLEFGFRDETALRRELESMTGLSLHLTLTDNTRTVMSLRPAAYNGALRVRLHKMFLNADPTVMHAIASWVKRPRCRKSGAVINRFIREHRHLMRHEEKRHVTLHTLGRYFDLAKLFNEVNREHFDGKITAAITWGKRPRPGKRRSIRFGSYYVEDNLIRIHPYLDQEFVPEFFVRYIVFHEMLHAHLGIEERESGRRRVHTPEFIAMEKQYPDYRRALAWENRPANLRKLLR